MTHEELPAPSDRWKTARDSSSRRGMRPVQSLSATCVALALACFDTTTPSNPPSSAGVDAPPPSAASGSCSAARSALDGNVGHLETTSVPPLTESEGPIAEAFAYLRDTAALILDVRANGGGYPQYRCALRELPQRGPALRREHVSLAQG